MKIKDIFIFLCVCACSFFVQTSFGASEAPSQNSEKRATKINPLSDDFNPYSEDVAGFRQATTYLPRKKKRPFIENKPAIAATQTYTPEDSEEESEIESESACAAPGYSADGGSSSGYSIAKRTARSSAGSMYSAFNPDVDPYAYDKETNTFYVPSSSSIPQSIGDDQDDSIEEIIDQNDPRILVSKIYFTTSGLAALNNKNDLIDHLNTIIVSINKLDKQGQLDPLNTNHLNKTLSKALNKTFSIYGIGYDMCSVTQLVIIHLQSPTAVALLIKAGAGVDNEFRTSPGMNENLDFYSKTLDLTLFIEDKHKAKQIADLLIAHGAKCSDGHEHAISYIIGRQYKKSSTVSTTKNKGFWSRLLRKKGE